MKLEQAEILLRQEVASGSPLGEALTCMLVECELANYRQTSRSADPYTTSRICGRGEGINSVLNRIAPSKNPILQAGGVGLPQEN